MLDYSFNIHVGDSYSHNQRDKFTTISKNPQTHKALIKAVTLLDPSATEPAVLKRRSRPRLRLGSSCQSLCHHLPIHNGNIDEEEENDKEVIHEAQQAEESLWDEVKRRGQVCECPHQAQQDTDAKHPEQTSDREHLPEGMAQECGDVP